MTIFHVLFDMAVIYGLIKFFRWVNKSYTQYTAPDKTHKRKVW